MKKYIFLVLSLVMLSGCGMAYKHQPINGLSQNDKICIINSIDTKAVFENTMVEWLREHNYQPQVLPANSNIIDCEWTLTYYGKWSWDVAFYLSDAEIKAYRNGNFAGESKFHVRGGNWNASPKKYSKAEPRVKEMMRRLFTEN